MNNFQGEKDTKYLIDYYHSERQYISSKNNQLFGINVAITSFFISMLSLLIALDVADKYLIFFAIFIIIFELIIWIKYYKSKKAIQKYHSLINKKAMEHFDKIFPKEFSKPKN